MSNLPPPTSGGAPYQPEQPTVAFNPLPPIGANPPQQKKSKIRLIAIIGAAVVVVAALVVGGLLVFGGDDDDGTVGTARASGAVEDVTVAADLDKTDHLGALKACPFDGVDDLAEDAPDGFDAAAAAKGDDRAVINQTDQSSDPLLLQCATGNDDGTQLYGLAAASIPPTELQDYISRTLTSATADFEKTTSFKGGTLQPFCTTPDDGAEVQPLCATAWFDKQLMVALFTTGDGSSTDVTTAWIKDDLDDVVEDLEGADPDKVEVTATQGFDIDASAAAKNLEDMINAAQIGEPDSQADQSTCVVADLGTVLASAPSGLDASALTGSPFNTIIRPEERTDPAFAVCGQTSGDNAVQIGVLVGQPVPDDFEAYVKRSSGSDDVTFEDTVAFRGGTLHPYCVETDGAVAFCETDWLSNDIQVGAFVGFDGVTADDATTLLTSTIDGIVETTAATDASTITPAG